jgi:hypothetical protein
MSQKDGRLILIKHGTVTFVGQQSGSITLTRDVIEKTTKSSNRLKEFFPGEAGGNVSVTGLVAINDTDFGDIFSKWKNSDILNVEFFATDNLDKITAQGYLVSFSHTSGKNEAQNYSLNIRLTGQIDLINN